MNNVRFDVIRTIIAFIIGILVGWIFFEYGNKDKSNNIYLGLSSGILTMIDLAIIMGLKETCRSVTSARVTSGIFLCLILIVDIVFSFFNFSHPLFVIINLVLFLIGLLIVVSILKVKE